MNKSMMKTGKNKKKFRLGLGMMGDFFFLKIMTLPLQSVEI